MRMDESMSTYESHPVTQSSTEVPGQHEPRQQQQQATISSSNVNDVHISSNADVTLINEVTSIDSLNENDHAIAFSCNTIDHCNNNGMDICNELDHSGPSSLDSPHDLIDSMPFLPSSSVTVVSLADNSGGHVDSHHSDTDHCTSQEEHTDSSTMTVDSTIVSLSNIPSVQCLVTYCNSEKKDEETSLNLTNGDIVEMSIVDSNKLHPCDTLLLSPASSEGPSLNCNITDGTDNTVTCNNITGSSGNLNISPPCTSIVTSSNANCLFTVSPSPSPSLSSSSSSSCKEDTKSRNKKSSALNNPSSNCSSSSSTSSTSSNVQGISTVASSAPGKSLKSSTSSTKGKSGMGCGRPGYITCSICSATKYYSHVQRRFGQFSCEPCSKFMKRFLRDPKKFTCFESGNCSIGRPSGEQEPRGVSVSRCKACWLKICLEKFVLESNIRDVIEQHYLPVFLTGPSGTVVTPVSLSPSASSPSSIASSASSVATFTATSSSNPLPSNSTTVASSICVSHSNDNRNKSTHSTSTNDSIVHDSCNTVSSSEYTSYSTSAVCNSQQVESRGKGKHQQHDQQQQPPPLPLPQRKRRPKTQIVSSDIDSSNNIFTSNCNSVLPSSYSPSSSSISSTASLTLTSNYTSRTRNTRNTRKGPTTVKYKKCEQKSSNNRNGSRNNRQSTRGKTANQNLNVNNYVSNSRRTSYDNHQQGYLLTPPADSDNEMDTFIVTDSHGNSDITNANLDRSTNLISSSALFRPITPCATTTRNARNINNKRTHDRCFDGKSGVKVKKNSDLLTLPYPKCNSSAESPFAENISPEKMILGKRSRGAKGVIGYNHDHDYGASHETDDLEEDDDDDCANGKEWNNCINSNVQYSAGSEDDATEDDYDNDNGDDDFECPSSLSRQRARGRGNLTRRQKKSLEQSHRRIGNHSSVHKVTPVDINHFNSSTCSNNVTVHSAIDSCDEYIDESYIKSQTDLPEYLSTLHCTTGGNLIASKSTGSKFKKFKCDPESPKAATKAEDTVTDYDHHSHQPFYSTSDLLNQEIIGEARDFNSTPNVQRNVKSNRYNRSNTRNISRGKRGKNYSIENTSSLPSTSSAFTCPLNVKGPKKCSSSSLQSTGRNGRLRDFERQHLNSMSSTTSSSNEFCDLIDYHNSSSHELLHSSTSGHQMLHQIDEDDEGYDDYFDPLVNTARESRDSLFFDEILNTNSPFL